MSSKIRLAAQGLLESSHILTGNKEHNLGAVLGNPDSSDAEVEIALLASLDGVNRAMLNHRPYAIKTGAYKGVNMSLLNILFEINDVLEAGGVKRRLDVPPDVLFTVIETAASAQKLLGLPKTVADFAKIVSEFKSSPRYQEPQEFGIRVVGEQGDLIKNEGGKNTGTAAIYMKYFSIHPGGNYGKRLEVIDVERILQYFAPFEGDGNVHGNIEALKETLRILKATPNARINFYMHF